MTPRSSRRIGAEGLRDVAVEHEVERASFGDEVGEAVANALREGADALVGRRPAPAQGEGDLRVERAHVEGLAMGADRRGERLRIDRVLDRERPAAGPAGCGAAGGAPGSEM